MRPRAVRRAAVVAVLALAALAGAQACSGGSETGAGNDYRFVAVRPGQAEVPIDDRRAAPVLRGETLQGDRLDVTDLRGSVVVVNFWGSWCAPCRAEADDLEQVYRSTKHRGVAFVGVNEKDDRNAAQAFSRTYDVTYPSLYDEDGSLAAEWPVAVSLPYTFVLDRDGRVAARFIGGVLATELQPVVERVAAEQAAGPGTGAAPVSVG